MTSEIALTILLGIPAAILAWWQLINLQRKARQEVLDRLREAAYDAPIWGENERSFEAKVDQIKRNGLDACELRARVALPDRRLWKIVRKLYAEGRIDVYLLRGIAGDDRNREVPKGTKMVLPIFVKGQLSPDMRPERSEVEALLSGLR